MRGVGETSMQISVRKQMKLIKNIFEPELLKLITLFSTESDEQLSFSPSYTNNLSSDVRLSSNSSIYLTPLRLPLIFLIVKRERAMICVQ